MPLYPVTMAAALADDLPAWSLRHRLQLPTLIVGILLRGACSRENPAGALVQQYVPATKQRRLTLPAERYEFRTNDAEMQAWTWTAVCIRQERHQLPNRDWHPTTCWSARFWVRAIFWELREHQNWFERQSTHSLLFSGSLTSGWWFCLFAPGFFAAFFDAFVAVLAVFFHADFFADFLGAAAFTAVVFGNAHFFLPEAANSGAGPGRRVGRFRI
jgi:hypothetical protein